MPLIFRQTTIRGIAVAPRSSLDRMNEFLNQHAISPVIDHVYPFELAREAYEHLSKGACGNVVISVGQQPRLIKNEAASESLPFFAWGYKHASSSQVPLSALKTRIIRASNPWPNNPSLG